MDRHPHFRIVEALSILQQRFTEPALRLSDVAGHARLSPTHLARLIKATTGITFLQHLRRLRVGRAEQLLLTTMLSIKEIAAQSGYSTSGSLTRDFHRVHACTPTAWRARRRSAQELLARDTNCEAIARTVC